MATTLRARCCWRRASPPCGTWAMSSPPCRRAASASTRASCWARASCRCCGKLGELTGELHRRGAPILAGTDGVGLELVRELELYVQAGFTPEEALQAATIMPARVMGLDAQ